MRVDEALALARAGGLARLDAQLLLARRLARPRAWLIAHDDAELPGDVEQGFRADLAARLDGVPMAYLSGEREFRGLTLAITPVVLVPRPDTETLVEWALECLADRSRPRVLDLGTGSGAIAIAVAHARPDARLTATDLDDAALELAQANARRHGVVLDCRLGSWWQGLDGQRFDLVLANPPYIA
ncbi:MAG: peptide chain release factor N(5)-glutamine methyltransferase, partial [Rubrivivax sp.]|nr:peptide chain release factor N(5)-glutamine methyltransferase [Rubrivivax sp.]